MRVWHIRMILPVGTVILGTGTDPRSSASREAGTVSFLIALRLP